MLAGRARVLHTRLRTQAMPELRFDATRVRLARYSARQLLDAIARIRAALDQPHPGPSDVRDALERPHALLQSLADRLLPQSHELDADELANAAPLQSRAIRRLHAYASAEPAFRELVRAAVEEHLQEDRQ